MIKCRRESEVGKAPRVCEGNDKFLAVPGTVDIPLPKVLNPFLTIQITKLLKPVLNPTCKNLKIKWWTD